MERLHISRHLIKFFGFVSMYSGALSIFLKVKGLVLWKAWPLAKLSMISHMASLMAVGSCSICAYTASFVDSKTQLSRRAAVRRWTR